MCTSAHILQNTLLAAVKFRSMNKNRETRMEQLAFLVDDFQQQVLPKIKTILEEEEKANEGMSKMPVNWWNGNSANAAQVEKSEISIGGLKEAITIIDKQLSEVYHVLMGTYA